MAKGVLLSHLRGAHRRLPCGRGRLLDVVMTATPPVAITATRTAAAASSHRFRFTGHHPRRRREVAALAHRGVQHRIAPRILPRRGMGFDPCR